MSQESIHASQIRRPWRDVPRVWKRRAVLMAAVGLVVAIPVTLLVHGGSGGRDAASGAAAGVPAQFRVHGAARLPALGIAMRVPRSWSVARAHGTIRLRSSDRTTALAVAAPGPEGQRAEILRTELGGIRRSYREVSIERGFRKAVGGLPARGAVVSAGTPAGTPIRLLVATASGDRHTYLVEAFSARNAPPQRLIQAQLALRTLRLSR
jgi:hypothetical protein